jgi:hypothetical protein
VAVHKHNNTTKNANTPHFLVIGLHFGYTLATTNKLLNVWHTLVMISHTHHTSLVIKNAPQLHNIVTHCILHISLHISLHFVGTLYYTFHYTFSVVIYTLYYTLVDFSLHFFGSLLHLSLHFSLHFFGSYLHFVGTLWYTFDYTFLVHFGTLFGTLFW